MRTIVNVFASLGLIFAILFVGIYYTGLITDEFQGSGGIAIIFLQLWAFIGVCVALLFGFTGRLMDRHRSKPAGRIANAAVATGLLGGLLLLVAPFIFG